MTQQNQSPVVTDAELGKMIDHVGSGDGIDGPEAYAALKELRERRTLEAALPSGMRIDDAARRKIELWFFRDILSEERLKLFSIFGMPVDEIGVTHGHQRIALRRVLSAIEPTPSPSHAETVAPYAAAPAPAGLEVVGWRMDDLIMPQNVSVTVDESFANHRAKHPNTWIVTPLVRLTDAQAAIEKLRGIVARCCNHLPNGAYCSPYASMEFMAHVPDEVLLATSSLVLRAEASEARVAELEKALTRIAEGNLGDHPWQANYERIRQVATEALHPEREG